MTEQYPVFDIARSDQLEGLRRSNHNYNLINIEGLHGEKNCQAHSAPGSGSKDCFRKTLPVPGHHSVAGDAATDPGLRGDEPCAGAGVEKDGLTS